MDKSYILVARFKQGEEGIFLGTTMLMIHCWRLSSRFVRLGPFYNGRARLTLSVAKRYD